MIPQAGTVVTVTTRYPTRSFWHKEDYEDYTLTGAVLASPKWLTSDQIAVSNPKHPNGFSVITLNKVIDIKTAEGAITLDKPTEDYKEWQFSGSKGNNYLVIRQKGKYNCTCLGYQFRKHCKHVEEAANE